MRLVKTGTAFATRNDIHGSPYENLVILIVQRALVDYETLATKKVAFLNTHDDETISITEIVEFFEGEYGRQLLDLVDLDARTLLEGLKKRMLKRRKDKRGLLSTRYKIVKEERWQI